jgi:hypothetical protein
LRAGAPRLGLASLAMSQLLQGGTGSRAAASRRACARTDTPPITVKADRTVF